MSHAPLPHSSAAALTALLARDRAAVWHPAAQMADYATQPPLVIARAAGLTLHTVDGRRVLDGISSWWCKSLGHCHPRVVAAVQQQLTVFDHHILAGATNEAVISLVERWLVHANRTHSGWFSKAFFADNGSTAVEVAVKMALQWQQQNGQPQRNRLIALEGAYHGETIGALSLTDCDRYRSPFAELLFPVHRLNGLPWRNGPDDPQWQNAESSWSAIAAQLEAVAATAAAVVIEPVMQGAGGVRLYSPDVIRRLRQWCDTHGALLIADEIAAGCWRLGHPLACHHAGVLPDLAVLAKGLTAGAVPFSMVLTTEAIYQGFLGTWASGRAFLHSNTFAGHALGVAAAHAMLDAIECDGVPAHIAAHSDGLGQRLRSAAADRPWVTNVRACGMMAALDLRSPTGAPLLASARTGWRVHRAALERGALLRPMGDSMYLMPPLITTAAELDELTAILFASIDAICATDC